MNIDELKNITIKFEYFSRRKADEEVKGNDVDDEVLAITSWSLLRPSIH
jgi:hypothetical protein